jgi:F-type H+-transporting ATPase subunit a
MDKGIEIHLAPSVLGHFFTIPITSTLVTVLIVTALLVVFAFFAGRGLTLKAKGFQVILESLIMFPYQFVKDTLENDKLADRVFPLVMTLFLFILFVNWFGLLPIVSAIGIVSEYHGEQKLLPLFYPGATDLNFTLALALVAFLAIELAGIFTLGAFKYIGKFITFKSPLAFVIGLIELLSEFGRIITFSFRLFGNIFAGKVLLLVIMFFVPLFMPIPFLAFEVFVGFIQAAIFAVLTLFFIRIAVEHHEEAHDSEEAAHRQAHA